MDPELIRFMERSDQQWKDMAALLSALDLKYDRLAESVQRMQTEHTEGRSNCGPPPHAPEQPNASDTDTTNNQRRTDNPINTRALRLDFPRYEGDEPSGWLYRAEQFFAYHQTPPVQQIRIASFHLEGEALQWYRWTLATNPLVSWNDFSKALVARFGPTEYEDYAESLAKLQQTGNLREYQKEFERLANQVPRLGESFLISCFIGGLKEEIRLNVKMFRPTTLTSAIGLARLQEEHQTHRRSLHRNPAKPPLGTTVTPTTSPTTAATPLPPVKRLTPAEAAERRRKHLCYNCDERWVAGHKCKQKTLFLIEEDNPGEDGTEEIYADAEAAEFLEISIAALAGAAAPQTMRVTVFIKRQPITALVDSGSTHNFLHPRLAQRLLCRVEMAATLDVRIVDGGRLKCSGCCPALSVRVQKFSFTADFYVLPLGGCDMVLGAQWLRTLGPILWDFTELSMIFSEGGRKHKIVGHPRQPVQEISAHVMEGVWRKEGTPGSLLVKP